LPFDTPVANPSSFKLEARFQRVCANCGGVGPFHAHHVVDKQTLRRQGLEKNQLYDTRNALRLCEGLTTKRCHFQHENLKLRDPWGKVTTGKLRTTKLLDDNIEYAFEVLGAYAVDFLRQEYDDIEHDPRIAELESRCD